MILFKKYHIPLIKAGIKTQTRRPLGRYFKVGSVHQIKTGFTKDDYCGDLRITAVRTEKLDSITESDARKEGYDSIDEYRKAYIDIYGSWLDYVSVQVIDFEYMGDVR